MDSDKLATKQDIRRLERLLKSTLDELNEKVQFNRWVKIGRAAEMLGISKRTLTKIGHRGEITYTRLGRSVYIDMISVYELLDKNKVERFDI